MSFRVAVSSLLIWVLAVTVAIWDFVHVQGMVYQFDTLESIGLIVVLAGFSVRKVGKRALGENLARGAESLRRRRLVKRGVYGYIRHPIYLGAILLNLGVFLLLSSPFGFLVMLGFIPCVLCRIRAEEKALVEKFGIEYRDYMRQTKRIIPFIY